MKVEDGEEMPEVDFHILVRVQDIIESSLEENTRIPDECFILRGTSGLTSRRIQDSCVWARPNHLIQQTKQKIINLTRRRNLHPGDFVICAGYIDRSGERLPDIQLGFTGTVDREHPTLDQCLQHEMFEELGQLRADYGLISDPFSNGRFNGYILLHGSEDGSLESPVAGLWRRGESPVADSRRDGDRQRAPAGSWRRGESPVADSRRDGDRQRAPAGSWRRGESPVADSLSLPEEGLTLVQEKGRKGKGRG